MNQAEAALQACGLSPAEELRHEPPPDVFELLSVGKPVPCLVLSSRILPVSQTEPGDVSEVLGRIEAGFVVAHAFRSVSSKPTAGNVTTRADGFASLVTRRSLSARHNSLLVETNPVPEALRR